MQYSLVALASFVAAAVAQSGVPACAASCVNLLPASCNPQDIKCICGNSSFITNVSCCVSKSCDAADQTAALQFAQQICGAGGVSLTVTGATCIGSSTSSAPKSTSSVHASTTAAGGSMSTPAASGATATNSMNSTGSVMTGSMMTPSATTSSSSISSGGVAKATAMAGFLGAAVAAVAML